MRPLTIAVLMIGVTAFAPTQYRRLFSANMCDGHAIHLSGHFSGGYDREVDLPAGAPFDVVNPSPSITWTDKDGTHLFVNPIEITCRP